MIATAEKPGNAPPRLLPHSANSANPNLPGTIGLSGPRFAAIREPVAEQWIESNFQSVAPRGGRGGDQG